MGPGEGSGPRIGADRKACTKVEGGRGNRRWRARGARYAVQSRPGLASEPATAMAPAPKAKRGPLTDENG